MEESSKKSKKHKRKHHEMPVIDTDVASHCEKEKDEKKKKSKKKKKAAHFEEEIECDFVKQCDEDSDKVTQKKRKMSDCENDIEEGKSKKKKHKRNENSSDISANLITENIEDIEPRKSKKKKSKRKKNEGDGIDNHVGEIDAEHKPDCKEFVKEVDLNENSEEIFAVKKKSKKKKHKKSKEHEDEVQSGNLEVVNEATEINTSSDKKKKKKHKDRDLGDVAEPSNNHRKDGEYQTCHTKDTISCTVSNTKESTDMKTGQWSSAELGDSERQNKFYRLLGGFKKGGDASQIQNKFGLGKKTVFSSPNNNSSLRAGGNFAMSKKQEEHYTKMLESDYDRAMTMNLNRGIGLGFAKPPEEGKKFFIDTKSSKSIKFDD